MKNKSKDMRIILIEEFKEKGMDVLLKSYGDKLPHKEILDDLSKNKRLKEHVEKVVRYMNNLLELNLGAVFNLNSKSKGSILSKELDPLREIIARIDNEEKKILLFTSLYHDIGKVINKPRHGPEGADLIKDSGREDRIKFYELKFRRPDFYLMSDLIRFHDYLGMTQTGETNYLTFFELLYPVANINIKEKGEKFLDLLFLLNLADISGSIMRKIENERFTILMEDFGILKRSHDNISKKVYRDIFIKEPPKDMRIVHKATLHVREPMDIIPQLRIASENSACERLRRLLRAALKRVTVNADYRRWVNNYPQARAKAKEFDDWFIRDQNIVDIIPVIRSIRALDIGQDCYTKFAFICKLDYALGFILELIQEMIKIEAAKSSADRKSPHDIRRDIAMTVIDLINNLIDLVGDFTLNDTRIGLDFERFGKIEKKQRKRLLVRLSGERGNFKKAEALTRLRESINMWVIKP